MVLFRHGSTGRKLKISYARGETKGGMWWSGWFKASKPLGFIQPCCSGLKVFWVKTLSGSERSCEAQSENLANGLQRSIFPHTESHRVSWRLQLLRELETEKSNSSSPL